ncbi:MAG TPA: TonB-dependent receptor [Xanthobacteraceae bacterium]|jgi:vitamin B12 transporter|nr:TonB-dependent receptor [Xanthobacteraceae bacterium]
MAARSAAEIIVRHLKPRRGAVSLVFGCCALSLLATGGGRAQTAVLPEITVYANQAPTDVAKVGVATTILQGSDLRARGYDNVSDALRTVPGVEVSRSGSQSSLTHVGIRGSQAKHVLVLIDGVPVNNLSDGAFDFADFSLEGVDRIEVIRGPQSGVHGADANAGVIAITTITGRGRKPGGELRIEGGTQDTGRIAGSAHASDGTVYGAVAFDRSTTAGYNISRFGDNTNGAYRTSVNATLGADITPDLNIEGSFRLVDRTTSIDPQLSFGPLAGFVFPSDPFGTDFNAFESRLGRVNARWTTFDGAFVQNFGAAEYLDRVDAFDTQTGAFQTRGMQQFLNYKGTVNVPYSAFGEKHTVTFAADWQRQSLSLNSDSLSFDPVAQAFWATNPTRLRTGIAGEYTVDLPTRTTLTGAVRREANSGFADDVTWRVTASQRLFTATRLHASVGTGVTNPTFIDQFGFFRALFIGNPNLKPESSIGWDAGWEQTWLDGRVITDLTYFNAQYTDKIVTVFDPNFHSTVVNAAGVSPRQGLEATLKVNPVSWATIAASYTYTDARLADGTPEIREPKNKASLNVTTHWLDGRLHVNGGVVFNDQMPDTFFGLTSSTVTLPAYTVVNASVAYDLRPDAQIYVRLENALDAQYEEIFSFRAPPFAAYAGLKLRFGDAFR